MKNHIDHLWAEEALDSRGNPTVQAKVGLTSRVTATASVPSGTSTGRGEAFELRDKDPRRFCGKAVLKAVSSINKVLSSLAIGADVLNQRKPDAAMCNADATLDKSRLGAKPIGHYGNRVLEQVQIWALEVDSFQCRQMSGGRRKPMNSNLAFVGRAELLSQLGDAYAARQHVLVLGPCGIGKTAVLRAFFENRTCIFCDVSAPLSRILHTLESSLAVNPGRMDLLARQRGLLASLATGDRLVVFDHVAKTSPQIARFMNHVAEKQPVWIGCRSDLRHEVGHIWQYLFRFKRIEVPPFSLRETIHLLSEAVHIEKIQPDTIVHARKLRTLSGGNPGTLIALVIQLKEHHYELQNSAGLHLLELDKRINSYRSRCF